MIVGSILAKLGLESASFDTKVKQSGKTFKDQMKGIRDQAQGMRNILELGGAAFVVTGVTKGINDIADAMEKLGKGEATQSDFNAELLKSIPLAGKLGEALNRLWNVDDAVYIAKIEKETKGIETMNSLIEYQIELKKRMNKESETDEVSGTIKVLKTLGIDTHTLEHKQSAAKIEEGRKKELAANRSSDKVKAVDKDIADLNKVAKAKYTAWKEAEEGAAWVSDHKSTRAERRDAKTAYEDAVREVAAKEGQKKALLAKADESINKTYNNKQKNEWMDYTANRAVALKDRVRDYLDFSKNGGFALAKHQQAADKETADKKNKLAEEQEGIADDNSKETTDKWNKDNDNLLAERNRMRAAVSPTQGIKDAVKEYQDKWAGLLSPSEIAKGASLLPGVQEMMKANDKNAGFIDSRFQGGYAVDMDENKKQTRIFTNINTLVDNIDRRGRENPSGVVVTIAG